MSDSAAAPQYPDDARRCSDVIRTHIAAGMGGKWAALRLSDGGSDGIAYDTRGDAIRHQLHESQCAYICIPHDDMTPRAAAKYLEITRQMYDNGLRVIDPDQELIPVMPQRSEQ